MSVHDCSSSMVVVAVDVGKNMVACSVTDEKRHRLFGPIAFAMTRTGLDSTVARNQELVPADVYVKVGIEAAGHYHQPLMKSESWPPGWKLVELNPAHVTEQRRVQGRRRVTTDAIDLEAITDLVLAGRGSPVSERAVVLGELTAWVSHRSRRVGARTALKNQLLGQLDRAFPGLTLALPDVLGTKVGRLIAEHFTDPARLASLGEARFIRFAGTRGLIVQRRVAARVVAAAREALPTRDAVVAREIVANDLQMLTVLDQQALQAEDHLALLLPQTPFAMLTSVPGWATVRATAYGSAIGNPARWPGPRQIYRASQRQSRASVAALNAADVSASRVSLQADATQEGDVRGPKNPAIVILSLSFMTVVAALTWNDRHELTETTRRGLPVWLAMSILFALVWAGS